MRLFGLLPRGFAWLFLLVIVLVSREVWLPCQSSSLPRWELPEVESESTHTHTRWHMCTHTNSPVPLFFLVRHQCPVVSLTPAHTSHTDIPFTLAHAIIHNTPAIHIRDACTLSCYHSIVCHLKRRLRSQERWGFHLAFSTGRSANLLVTQTPGPPKKPSLRCHSFLLLIWKRK